jgi:hypothetical protein
MIFIESDVFRAFTEAGIGLMPAWRGRAVTTLCTWFCDTYWVAYIVVCCLVLARTLRWRETPRQT